MDNTLEESQYDEIFVGCGYLADIVGISVRGRIFVIARRWARSLLKMDATGSPRETTYSDRHALLYEYCADARSRKEISTRFDDASWVDGALEEFVERDLVIHFDDRYLSLPCRRILTFKIRCYAIRFRRRWHLCLRVSTQRVLNCSICCCGDGILHRSPNQPVLSRDGTSARWMLDSLAVTLSPRGGQLAGACMIELLKRFDGRQIATYGLTGIPILQSCLLQDTRYRGLLVRKERKQHGSLKLIEGFIDKDEPVILIDDSVSSGLSMNEATERLEEAGLRVEGGICLVRFGWDNGYAQMQERGYHMEAVYDIWDDFMSQMDDEELPLANPSKWFPEFRWSPKRAPEGLHPAALARCVVSEYLSSRELLRPPERLDANYDSAGGAWVSIRSRENIHRRHARDGYWHFPLEAARVSGKRCRHGLA